MPYSLKSTYFMYFLHLEEPWFRVNPGVCGFKSEASGFTLATGAFRCLRALQTYLSLGMSL